MKTRRGDDRDSTPARVRARRNMQRKRLKEGCKRRLVGPGGAECRRWVEMMQLCVCKEGGRRNRGGNRSRSLGHQPAVEPATLPPTTPYPSFSSPSLCPSCFWALHAPSTSLSFSLARAWELPSLPCRAPRRRDQRFARRNPFSPFYALRDDDFARFKFFKQCQLACSTAARARPITLPTATMFTGPRMYTASCPRGSRGFVRVREYDTVSARTWPFRDCLSILINSLEKRNFSDENLTPW